MLIRFNLLFFITETSKKIEMDEQTENSSKMIEPSESAHE
jgi:hypothetical protein